MLFYEDLIKKIESENEALDLKKIEKFGLNINKKISGYGISIPLILIGLYQIYSYTVSTKWYVLIIGMIILGLGLKHFKTIFSYFIIVDTENKLIKSNKLTLSFDNVDSVSLKELKIGQKIVPTIDIITQDKKQILIPLYMNRITRFIKILKSIFSDKFSIIK